jgi:drug/metabolite transporter (DMT)-like permease
VLAVVLALAAAVSYSGSDYVAGLASRGTSVIRVTTVAQITNAILIIPFVPLLSTHGPSARSLAWGAAAGVSGVIGTVALYMGFRHAAFSVASTVSAVGSAAFSVIAGLLFGERPGALSLAGIALALPAIASVSASPGQPGTGQPSTGQPSTGQPVAGQPVAGHAAAGDASTAYADGADDDGLPAGDPAERPTRSATGRHAAGVVWGLIAGVAIGLFFICLNRAGSSHDLWPLAASELAAVLAIICMAAVTRQLRLPQPGTRWLSLLTGITASAGTLFYFLATHHGLLAVTAVITTLYPAGTIVLARVLLGERLTTVRMIGLCLAAASVALIAVAGAG